MGQIVGWEVRAGPPRCLGSVLAHQVLGWLRATLPDGGAEAPDRLAASFMVWVSKREATA